MSWELLPKVIIFRQKGGEKSTTVWSTITKVGKGRSIRWDLANVLRCINFLASWWTSEQGCHWRSSRWCVFELGGEGWQALPYSRNCSSLSGFGGAPQGYFFQTLHSCIRNNIAFFSCADILIDSFSSALARYRQRGAILGSWIFQISGRCH